MIKLRVVQARYGDCVILESGNGKRRKYVLVDGGPDLVYGPYLRGELAQIAASGGKLDFVVLSHIDNDHVLGLLEFMDELKQAHEKHQPPLIAVEGIWHNGFSKLVPEAGDQAAQIEQSVATEKLPLAPGQNQGADADLVPASSFGVNEGHQLQVIAEGELGLDHNYGFPDGLVCLETAPRPVRSAGMRLWVIGPKKANLEDLRQKWIQWLMREGIPYAPGQPKPVKPDDSVNNLSSIMLLAEGGGRRILLTGDGLGDDIIAGLEQVGKLPPGGTMHVDLFKLPHHGSARNAVGALFDRVLADTYMISANGRYDNPDLQTLLWLVDAACRQNREIKIFSTNPCPSLDELVRQRPPEQNHYTLTIMDSGASSALL